MANRLVLQSELRHLPGMTPVPAPLAIATTVEDVLAMWPVIVVAVGVVGGIVETRHKVASLDTQLAEERVKTAALEKAKEKAEADLASLREWRNETKANIEALRANSQVNSERTTRIEGKVDSMHDDMKEVKGMLRSFISAAGSGTRATAA